MEIRPWDVIRHECFRDVAFRVLGVRETSPLILSGEWLTISPDHIWTSRGDTITIVDEQIPRWFYYSTKTRERQGPITGERPREQFI